MTKSDPELLNVDQVQFVRLLSALDAAALDFDTLDQVGDSMNLERAELFELFIRARKVWDKWLPLLKLELPLSKEVQDRQAAESCGTVEGVVGVKMGAFSADFDDTESFLSFLSESLIGEDTLSNVRYKPLFADGEKVYFHVEGDL